MTDTTNSQDPTEMPSKRTIDDLFTDLADIVSDWTGRWQIFGLALLGVLVWIAFGPIAHFSDTWQLWVNTPTTIVELFIGFLCAAAANRVQRFFGHILAKLERAAEAELAEQEMEEKSLEIVNRKLDLIMTRLDRLEEERTS